MSFHDKGTMEGTTDLHPPQGAQRKAYTPPRLQSLGDLRDLTLGGSPGLGDSGMPAQFAPLGGGPTPPPASGKG